MSRVRSRTRNQAATPTTGEGSSARRSRRRAVVEAAAPAPIRPSKTLAIGMGSIVSVLALLLLLAAWGTGLTVMMLFGDRLSARIIAENSQMQDAYEQRLQAYRAEIARLSLEVEQSRFDSTSVEGRVIELGRRQRQLELRVLALKQLSDLVGLPSGAPAAPAPAQPPANRIRFEAPDETDPVVIPVQADAPPVIEQAPATPREQSSDIEAFILRMDRSLRNVDQTQTAILLNLQRSSDVRSERIRAALSLIGLQPQQILQMRGRGDVVIPNIVLPLSEQSTPFAQGIERARQNHGLTLGIRDVVQALPTLRPTNPNIRFSSGFGYRIHPIHGSRRLHAGIDMAAPIGEPIFAAGSGVVQSAGWGGGYGNLIQVDHGNGVLTRYAHLSQIKVTPGQPVSKGTLIGLMGTTGASTGSHLHFETRIHGSPVNPACFLLAGDRIAGVQTIPLPCEQPPVWQRRSDEDEDDDS
jgi:murein DD-endopeptidase MepM/ murein hydrolase activator NlpD